MIPRRPHRRPSGARPVEPLEPRTLLATFVVATTADAGPGSLRQAIIDANASSGADEIHFDIPGAAGAAAARRITLASPLPAVSETVLLDATTQPAYAG